MENEADPELQRYSRRASLVRAGGLGAAGVLAGAALRPSGAEAATASALHVVLDAAGGGDFTDVETAVAALEPGRTLFVKRGTYTVKNGPLRPPRDSRILGEGYGSHIVAANGFNKHMFMVSGDNVVFENLRVNGNGANQALASGNCIYYDANNGRVTGCWVHDAAGYNIVAFPGVDGLVIDGNHVYNPREIGIELQGATHCSVVGNVVWNAGEVGILLWDSTGTCELNTVSGNSVRDCRQRGIQVFDGARENTIMGN